MKRLVLIVALVTMVAATFAATAQAGGGFTSITARYGYSPIVHYRIRYEVWPGAYMDCVPDEYGLTDPDCYDYEAGNAASTFACSGCSRAVDVSSTRT